jgi:hypothetical protein
VAADAAVTGGAAVVDDCEEGEADSLPPQAAASTSVNPTAELRPRSIR